MKTRARPPVPAKYVRAKLRPNWWLARILAKPPRLPADAFRGGLWCSASPPDERKST